MISLQTVESIPADEQILWKKIRKELESIGVSVMDFEANKLLILNWLKQAVDAGNFHEQIFDDNISGSLPQRLPIHDLSMNIAGETKETEVPVSRRSISEGSITSPSDPTAPSASFHEMWKGLIKTIKGKESLAVPTQISETDWSSQLCDTTENSADYTVEHSEDFQDVFSTVIHLGSPPTPENLYDASFEGDIIKVDSLLTQGVDVNAHAKNLAYYSEGYETALIGASKEGQERTVQLLLDNGAHVNASGSDHGNALEAASSRGHEQTVRLLLNHGAHVNAVGSNHGAALQAACLRGHEKIVRILLRSGADINAFGGVYGTALIAAPCQDHQKILRNMNQGGAKIEVFEKVYGTALIAASSEGHENIVRYLRKRGYDINTDRGNSGAPLRAYEQIVHANEGDIKVWGENYGTSLITASISGHEKIVRILLDNGADVNASRGDYGTALIAASWKGHEKIVRILHQHGADINASGGGYGTALIAASWRGNEKIVRILSSEMGANINAYDDRYGTALILACHLGRRSIVRILLEEGGANVNVNFVAGRHGTALEAALQAALKKNGNGNVEIVRTLLAHGAEVVDTWSYLRIKKLGITITSPSSLLGSGFQISKLWKL